jgi:hypothetical protein
MDHGPKRENMFHSHMSISTQNPGDKMTRLALRFTVLSITCLISSSILAEAVSSFLSIVPIGTHYGKNCKVEIVALDSAVQITASDPSNLAIKTIFKESDYFLNLARKIFVQKSVMSLNNDGTRYTSEEIRTNLADNNTINVAIEEMNVDNTNTTSSAVNCEIALPVASIR